MNAEPPFTVLGIDPDADEKAIKRAYVALVRQHRPDKDPAGFARIHAAYEAALRMHKEGWTFDAWRTEQALDFFDAGDAKAEAEAEAEEEAPASDPVRPPDVVTFAPPMTLEELVTRVGPERAVVLVDESTDELLISGDACYLADQLESEAAQRLLIAGHDIARPLLKTSAALAYSAPERARALHDGVELGGGSLAWLDDRALLAHSFSAAFEKAGGRELPPELSKLLALLPLVGDRRVAQLIDSALSFASTETQTFIDTMGRLPVDLLDSIGRYALDDADDGYPDPEPDISEHTFQDLWRDLDRRLDADPTNSWSKLLILVLGTGVPLWYWIGWLGLVAAAALFMVAGAVFVTLTDPRLYARHVRPAVLGLTLQTGVAPAHLAAGLKLWPWASEITRFTDEIREDPLLLLAHRLVVGKARLQRRFDEDFDAA